MARRQELRGAVVTSTGKEYPISYDENGYVVLEGMDDETYTKIAQNIYDALVQFPINDWKRNYSHLSFEEYAYRVSEMARYKEDHPEATNLEAERAVLPRIRDLYKKVVEEVKNGGDLKAAKKKYLSCLAPYWNVNN